MTNQAAKATLLDLTTALQRADPRVLLVPERVLQRIIRFDRRLSTLDIAVPHAECYFIRRERLLEFTTRYEYQLELGRDLPEMLILLPALGDEDEDQRPAGESLFNYWRLLFHIRVHLEYRQQAVAAKFDSDRLLERLQALGAIPFAEARAVLRNDELLLPPINYLSMYTEFAAKFLEIWYFSPQQLAVHFPSIRDFRQAAEIFAADLDHAALHQSTRPEGAAEKQTLPPDLARSGEVPSVEALSTHADSMESQPRAYHRWMARSNRLDRVGNFVKAAILRQMAARHGPIGERTAAQALAQDSLARFADRLAKVLDLPAGQATELADALQPVLTRADRGFRQIESRLLYDLQKVCTEHERGVYAIDLWYWIASLGKSPLRRPLPLLREVLVTRHLKSALQKLQISGLGTADSQRLLTILERYVEHARKSLRNQVRPLIVQVFLEEGCRAQNVVELTAFKKVVEEILDRVVEHGQLSMGHLRDSISQSNIKLPDLLQIRELITGDQLLRIDRRLATALDGVYHRGPIYLRMSHRLSSLAFGTKFGRIMTRYVALPFGGAYLVLESFRHILHFLLPQVEATSLDGAAHAPATDSSTDVSMDGIASLQLPAFSFVLVFGIFLMLLIENSNFRSWCLERLKRFGKFWVYLFRDFPEILLRLPWVRRMFDSPWYVAFINYVLKPLIVTGVGLLLVDRVWRWLPDRRIVSEAHLAIVPKVFTQWIWWVIAFLAVNLLLNSPIGRYADALVMDHLRRGWRELRLKVFAATFRFIVDSFQWMLRTIEQVIYTVDELLRFRSGENWPTIVVKAFLGLFWSIVSYVVRIYITLLIEPQINPIKHFPVVTVSHKMILPFSIELTRLLAAPLAPMGTLLANTIAGTTVFLLPGVFGFLAWELKENWRLYAANRSQNLNSIPLGSHGETLARLLRAGFHSGTVPKLFSKLRRAWRKAMQTGNRRGIVKVHDRLQHVEHAIQVFFEREWIALLHESRAWRDIALQIQSVRLSCNEMEIDIVRDHATEGPLRVMFADLGGWLLVRIVSLGWAADLSEMQRKSMHAAFRGVYRYAGIDLVWDELIRGLGLSSDPAWYDFNRDGLQVWTSRRFDGCVQYKLRDAGATQTLVPQPKFIVAPPQVDVVAMVFSQTNDSWNSWVATWEGFAQTPDSRSRASTATPPP